MRVLVTGAGGFLGRHLVERLLARGDAVTAVDLDPAGLADGADAVAADVTDEGAMARAAEGAEAVIHAAAVTGLWARDPGLFERVNHHGTRTVLAAANAGRIAVLGRPDLTDGVPDLAPGDGPAVNLAGFMARLPAGTRLMVVPVDMPTLDPAVLRLLAVQARGGVPRGKILPAALTVPAGPVAPRGNALRDLWAALDLTEIDLPSDLSLANINTPEDLSVLAAEAAPWT